jgi:hypothetical protein
MTIINNNKLYFCKTKSLIKVLINSISTIK